MRKKYEYELKVMLTEQEYSDLMDINGKEPYTQTNYYFDTFCFDLHDKKIVVRIREKDGKYELTVKTKKNNHGQTGIVSMKEHNRFLEKKLAEKIISDQESINEYLTGMKWDINQPLKYAGKIHTIRRNTILDGDMPPAEIDKSEYAGISDYELEWEIDKTLYSKAIYILGNMGIYIEDRQTGLSKYSRLVKTIREGRIK